LPGGPPISGFIAFLLTSVLKFAWGGYCIYPPPSPTSPPCVHLCLILMYFVNFFGLVNCNHPLIVTS
jgi:hypothetical protein